MPKISFYIRPDSANIYDLEPGTLFICNDSLYMRTDIGAVCLKDGRIISEEGVKQIVGNILRPGSTVTLTQE